MCKSVSIFSCIAIVFYLAGHSFSLAFHLSWCAFPFRHSLHFPLHQFIFHSRVGAVCQASCSPWQFPPSFSSIFSPHPSHFHRIHVLCAVWHVLPLLYFLSSLLPVCVLFSYLVPLLFSTCEIELCILLRRVATSEIQNATKFSFASADVALDLWRFCRLCTTDKHLHLCIHIHMRHLPVPSQAIPSHWEHSTWWGIHSDRLAALMTLFWHCERARVYK